MVRIANVATGERLDPNGLTDGRNPPPYVTRSHAKIARALKGFVTLKR